MSSSPALMAGLVFLGALLNLDRQVCGPFMLGRPLMAGLVLGLAAGEVGYGVWLGLSAELLWLAALPLGGRITPNAGLAVSAAFIAWLNSGLPSAGPSALVLAFLTVPVWAKAMNLIDHLCRRLTPKLLARVQAGLAAGREPPFMRLNLSGLALTLVLSAAVLSAAALLNIQVIRAAVCLAPQAMLMNLGFMFKLLPFAGLTGMAVFLETRDFPLYLGGLAAGLLVLGLV